MNSAEEDVKDETKPSQGDGEAIESAELTDYDDSDEVSEEDYDSDSDSDYGKPHKSKGKRIHGRQKTKLTEEARIVAALEVRRKRMRLNHSTPDSNKKNPKRHLFGPLAESRDPSETASLTPSKPANANNDMKKVNRTTSSYSPAAGRMTRRKLAMTEYIPRKQSVNTPPSLHDSASPAARPSLIAKLKTQKPSVTTGVDMRGKRKATSNHAMTKDKYARKEEAVGQESHHVMAHEKGRETRSKTRMTRQHQRDLAATKAHNNAPESPQPKKTLATRHRQGAVASSVELPEARLGAPTSSASADDKSSSSPPKTPSKVLPPSPNTNMPVSKPSTPPPLQVASASTFAPYPPMSPRSVSPFTRGARIALENLLADHQSDPFASLILLPV